MQIKSDHSAAANPSKVSTACVNCGAEERWLLHHVRHDGIFRRVCTTCVLRLHPQSFCPICFQVYPPFPSNDAVLTCSRCSSSSHSHCVVGPSASPYVCPMCANPNAPVFKLNAASKETCVEISDGQQCRMINRDAAKRLLAAAKIAADSMSKAAEAARAEAEKMAMEAAVARKRAKEALERMANLVGKKYRKKNSNARVDGGDARGVRCVALGKRQHIVPVTVGSRNRIAGDSVNSSLSVEGKISEKVDVGENLNEAVELGNNKKMIEPTDKIVELEVPANDNRVLVNDGGLVADRKTGGVLEDLNRLDNADDFIDQMQYMESDMGDRSE